MYVAHTASLSIFAGLWRRKLLKVVLLVSTFLVDVEPRGSAGAPCGTTAPLRHVRSRGSHTFVDPVAHHGLASWRRKTGTHGKDDQM